MALLRTRSTWTGVAGSPAYMNLYWVAELESAGLLAEQHGDVLEACQAYQNNQCSWQTDSTVVEIDPLTGDIVDAVSTATYSGVGAVTQVVLPRMAQVLVRLRSGVYVSGREIRGRVNIPYIGSSQNDTGGKPDGAMTDAIALAFQPLLGSLGGTGLAIYSPKNQNSVYVSEATVSPEWATLRSRAS